MNAPEPNLPSGEPGAGDAPLYSRAPFHFEDVTVGRVERSGTYRIGEEDIIAFARRYDPMAIHIDRAAAAAGPYGAITAPGTMILAVRQRLMTGFAFPNGVIVCAGFDTVRFLAPLRAGQTCQVEICFLDKRASASRPDRGIVVIGITLLADGQPILTLNETLMMYRRDAAE